MLSGKVSAVAGGGHGFGDPAAGGPVRLGATVVDLETARGGGRSAAAGADSVRDAARDDPDPRGARGAR